MNRREGRIVAVAVIAIVGLIVLIPTLRGGASSTPQPRFDPERVDALAVAHLPFIFPYDGLFDDWSVRNSIMAMQELPHSMILGYFAEHDEIDWNPPRHEGGHDFLDLRISWYHHRESFKAMLIIGEEDWWEEPGLKTAVINRAIELEWQLIERVRRGKINEVLPLNPHWGTEDEVYRAWYADVPHTVYVAE